MYRRQQQSRIKEYLDVNKKYDVVNKEYLFMYKEYTRRHGGRPPEVFSRQRAQQHHFPGKVAFPIVEYMPSSLRLPSGAEPAQALHKRILKKTRFVPFFRWIQANYAARADATRPTPGSMVLR